MEPIIAQAVKAWHYILKEERSSGTKNIFGKNFFKTFSSTNTRNNLRSTPTLFDFCGIPPYDFINLKFKKLWSKS